MTTRTPQDYALEPCPFCGAGETHIKENGKVWLGMRFSEPASVSVLHFCEPVPSQPSRSLERVGRDLESAIAAWNRRAPQSGWLPISEAPKQQVSQDGSNHYGEYLLVWCPGAPRPFRARWWWRDASGPIKIDGGDQRDITIHPLKPSTKGESTNG